MSSFPSWINDLASLSSIMGLGVTGWLLYEAKKLRDSFLMKARLPELTKSLSSIASNILTSIKDWDNSKSNILSNLSKCKSILNNINSKIHDKNIKNDIIALQNKLEKKKKFIFFNQKIELTELDKDDIWNIYSDINLVLEGLQQFSEDLRWK